MLFNMLSTVSRQVYLTLVGDLCSRGIDPAWEPVTGQRPSLRTRKTQESLEQVSSPLCRS